MSTQRTNSSSSETSFAKQQNNPTRKESHPGISVMTGDEHGTCKKRKNFTDPEWPLSATHRPPILSKSQPELVSAVLRYYSLLTLWQLLHPNKTETTTLCLLLAQQELEYVAQRHYAFHALAASFHDEHAAHPRISQSLHNLQQRIRPKTHLASLPVK
jgi:hypothetical protein